MFQPRTKILLAATLLLGIVSVGVLCLAKKERMIPTDPTSVVTPTSKTSDKELFETVHLRNGNVIISFQLPSGWLIESRNAPDKKMNVNEMRDFLGTSYRGNIKTDSNLTSDYADLPWSILEKMTEEELRRIFKDKNTFAPGFPSMTVTSDTNITYTDLGWDQIHFYFMDDNMVDDQIRKLSSNSIVSQVTIGSLLARVIKLELPENGKAYKGATGGQYIFVDVQNSDQALFIVKEAYVPGVFEDGFCDILKTLKIENTDSK